MPFSAAGPVEPLDVAEGYGLTGVGEKHTSPEALGARFRDERNWWLATSRPDGRPHSVPVWGVAVEGKLLFGSDPLAVKTKNMARNPAVVLHLESGDEVCILNGVARRLPLGEVPASLGEVYEAKYGIFMDPKDPAGHWYEVIPQTLLSWLEADFVDTVARWRFPPV